MEEHRGKIRSILGGAVNTEALRESRKAVGLAMAALIIGAVVLTVVVSYFFFTPRIERAETRAGEATEQAAAFKTEAERMRDLHIYTSMLPIENLIIKNQDGLLRVSGIVKNLGRRPVNDIELKAFVVDEDGTVVSEFKHIAKSPDGKPLYRWQRRHFHFETPALSKGKDMHVVITGIEFD